VAHLNGLPADLDHAAAAIGQVDRTSRNLSRQPQSVGGACAGRLDAAAGLPCQSGGDLVRVRRDRAERGVQTWVVVEAAPEAADDAFFGQPGKCLIYGGTRAKFEKLARDEHRTAPALFNLFSELLFCICSGQALGSSFI